MRFMFGLFMTVVLLMAGCVPIQPASEPPRDLPGPEAPSAALPEVAVLARAFLAEELGISAESIEVIEVEAVNWPDGCLGVHQSDVMCLMVITPGYRIVLGVDGVQHVLHTDQSGQTILIAPSIDLSREPVSGPTRSPREEPMLNAAQLEIAALARSAAAAEFGLAADGLDVVEVEAVEWPDACLGVYGPDEMCATVITPGYRVVLEAGGEVYILHTNADGQHIRVAEGPELR